MNFQREIRFFLVGESIYNFTFIQVRTYCSHILSHIPLPPPPLTADVVCERPLIAKNKAKNGNIILIILIIKSNMTSKQNRRGESIVTLKKGTTENVENLNHIFI